jgi:hypothetical protein
MTTSLRNMTEDDFWRLVMVTTPYGKYHAAHITCKGYDYSEESRLDEGENVAKEKLFNKLKSLGHIQASGDTAKQGEKKLETFNKHHENIAEILVKCLGVNSRQVHWREATPMIASYVSKEHNKVWNAAVEHCIVKLGSSFPEYGNKEFSITGIRKELELLKIKE